MSTCDVCMRDVDGGVACGDCQYPDPDEHIRIVAERDELKIRVKKLKRDSRDANLEVGNQMALRDEARKDLAAAQARERELRAALLEQDEPIRRLRFWASQDPTGPAEANDIAKWVLEKLWRIEQLRADALSAPQDTTALREFGLKVARRAITPSKRDQFGLLVGETAEAIVDAVLKGAE